MEKRIIVISGCIIIVLSILVLVNYIYFNKYYFELNGKDTILLNVGDDWEDPLYKITNNHKVSINNDINYNKEGEYHVYYNLRIGLFKKTLVRKILIVDTLQETGFTFNIDGDNPYYLMKNHDYKEFDYEAFDKTDGDITNKVSIINNINNEIEGTYNVIYQVKNSDGVIKKITRNVIVYLLKYEGSLKYTEYTQNNEITINIDDSNYSYTLLPNNGKTLNNNINYPVNENSIYQFKIYDKNNNFTLYDANVENIDNTPPTGTCTYTLNDTNGIIDVTANDNTEIKGYEYQYGKNKTDIIETNNYSTNTLDYKANVTIYDKANNKTNITCKTIDKSKTTDRSYTLQKFDQRQFWLYTPNDTSTRNKVPLVIYLHGGGLGDVNRVNNYALPKHIYNGQSFPYYAAIPFFPQYNITETNDYVMKLIDFLVDKHNIDPERIIISGGSNGSDPSYYIAANNQNKFSAMLIIAGHTSITDFSKLTYLPIWFHQGTEDNSKGIQNYVNKINSLGGKAMLTKYHGGHSAPNNAFAKDEVTEWILNQRIKK